MNVCRDFLFLAAEAYRNKKYQHAATLFALSMDASDSKNFFKFIEDQTKETAVASEIMGKALCENVFIDENGDPETDDIDPDMPGQYLTPSTISSSNIKLSPAIKSPIKVK